MIMEKLDPQYQAAYRAAYPTAGDYIQRAAERLGVVNPKIEAHNFGERLALDGSRFISGSFIPFGGWAGTATRAAREAGQLARATSWLERGLFSTARHPVRTAASIGGGAIGSVTGGEVAERIGLPRWVGELPGAVFGGGVPHLAAASANALREAGLTREALRTITPEEAYRAIHAAKFRQDSVNRLDMGNLMSMDVRLRGDLKRRLDGLIMADTVPTLLKRRQTGEEMLTRDKWALDDLRARRSPSPGRSPWSLPQIASSAINDWRYGSALKHYRGSWQDWFLREHPELSPHLRVVRHAPVETRLSRNPYLPRGIAYDFPSC